MVLQLAVKDSTTVCFPLSGIGLDRLPSGAVLLTVELPAVGHGGMPEYPLQAESSSRSTPNRSVAEAETKAARKPSGLQDPGNKPEGVPSKTFSVSAVDEGSSGSTGAPKLPTDGALRPAEAAMIPAIAAPLVEAADILLVPLLHHGGTAAQPYPDNQKTRRFGELLFLEAPMEANARDSSEPNSGRSSSSASSMKTGQQLSSPLAAPVDRRVRLPEDVVQLFRAMKHLMHPHAVQEAPGDTAVQARTYQRNRETQQALQTPVPRHLPHIVLLVGVWDLGTREAIDKPWLLRRTAIRWGTYL